MHFARARGALGRANLMRLFPLLQTPTQSAVGTGGDDDALLNQWFDEALMEGTSAAGNEQEASAPPAGRSVEEKPAAAPAPTRTVTASSDDADMEQWITAALEASTGADPPQEAEDSPEEEEEDDFFNQWILENEGADPIRDPEEVPQDGPFTTDEEFKQYDVLVSDSKRPAASKTGWLQKRGQNFRAYKRRFFEIRGSQLLYYGKEIRGTGEDHRGTIELTSALVVPVEEEQGEVDVRKGNFLHFIDDAAARAAATWFQNSEVNCCMRFKCQRRFNVATRRHHCRYCGRIFCKYCITQGRGRKLKNEPAKVTKHGYEGVKICISCALLPETRMTRKMLPISNSRLSMGSLGDGRQKRAAAGSVEAKAATKTKTGASCADKKFNSAPIKSTDKPAQLPPEFMMALGSGSTPASTNARSETGVSGMPRRTSSYSGGDWDSDAPAALPDAWLQELGNSDDDSVREPPLARVERFSSTESSAAPAALPAAWLYGLKGSDDDSDDEAKGSNDKAAAQSAKSAPVAQDGKGAAADGAAADGAAAESSDYKAKRANSIKRRKNRGGRRTQTRLEMEQILEGVVDSKSAPKDTKSSGGNDGNGGSGDDSEGPPVQDAASASREGQTADVDTVQFCVQPHKRLRKYYFKAETPAICREWIRAIKLHTRKSNPRRALKHFDPTPPGQARPTAAPSSPGRKQLRVRFAAKNEYYETLREPDRNELKANGSMRTGYLAKCGKNIRSWKIRLFCLTKGRLTYFRIKGKSEIKGFIQLRGAEVIKGKSLMVKKRGWVSGLTATRQLQESQSDAKQDTSLSVVQGSAPDRSKPHKHKRSSTKHVLGTRKELQGSTRERRVSTDMLPPNVRMEKVRYVHEFVIKTKELPRDSMAKDVHVSKLKKGRTFYLRAATPRDRNEWIKAIREQTSA